MGDGPDLEDGDPDWAGYTTEEYTPGDALLFVSRDYGSAVEMEIVCSSEELAAELGLSSEKTTVTGIDAAIALNEGFDTTTSMKAEGNYISIVDQDGFEMKIKVEPGTAGTQFEDTMIGEEMAEAPDADGDQEINMTVLDAGAMILQIGANTYQEMSVNIPNIGDRYFESVYQRGCVRGHCKTGRCDCYDIVYSLEAWFVPEPFGTFHHELGRDCFEHDGSIISNRRCRYG